MLSNEADVILKENCLTDFINTLLLLFKKKLFNFKNMLHIDPGWSV